MIDISSDPQQQLALDRCVDMSPANRVVPVSGEAGTGKTSLLAHVYNELVGAGYRVVLCAPTGKAVKRIYEATGIRAMTIHRLLEYPHPGERDEKGKPLAVTEPRRDKNNPLNYNVVLADEYMMVNREVHSNLIFALPRAGVIRMFGDVNQLKPIEQGKLAGKEAPFEQAIRRFDGVVLETLHRTGAGSGIAENGRLILKGRVPRRRDDFAMHITDSPVERIVDSCLELLEDGGVNLGSNQGQIISPTKRSWVGTYKLNLKLQNVFNPQEYRVTMPRHEWDKKMPIALAVGDKVIWTENAYDLRNEWERWEEQDYQEASYIDPPPNKWIMNGETGVVTYVNDDGVGIDTGDRIVDAPSSMTITDRRGNLVTVDPRRSIDLAYCITTHKAQGSEWPHVMYVLNKSTSFMQCRSNLYTGISRAREQVHLVSDQRSLSNSVFQTMTVHERKNK